VNCLSVRERLTEQVLGVLPKAERAVLDRHLEWCAACRKEAGELQRAAATLAYSVAPVEPPAELEDRAVSAVRSAAGRRRAPAPRRSRVAAAGVLAATLALSGLGWGAVMAGRAERAEKHARDAQEQQQQAMETFREEVLRQLPGLDPEAIVEISTLLSPSLQAGRGDALVLLSPSGDDLAFVLVDGLTEARSAQLPLRVRLVSEDSTNVLVGEIRTLDQAGGGGVFATFSEDLTHVGAVVVKDARGRIVLRGTLSVYEPTA
jgi:Putative zinc-finger